MMTWYSFIRSGTLAAGPSLPSRIEKPQFCRLWRHRLSETCQHPAHGRRREAFVVVACIGEDVAHRGLDRAQHPFPGIHRAAAVELHAIVARQRLISQPE